MLEQGERSLDKPNADVVMELSERQVLEGFNARRRRSWGRQHDSTNWEDSECLLI